MDTRLHLYPNWGYSSPVIQALQISRRALKSLERVPKSVASKFALCRLQVLEHGLEVTQRVPGYHDEPLGGKLRGVRSVRLSEGYRAYYRVVRGSVICVLVEEVNKHDYKAIERLFGG